MIFHTINSIISSLSQLDCVIAFHSYACSEHRDLPRNTKSHAKNGVRQTERTISDVLWALKGNNPTVISKETHKFWHAQYFES